MINKSRVVALTRELIRARSENPGGTEKEAARIVEKELLDCGFDVKTYEFEKDRTNVVGVLRGTSSKKALLLTPHLDTVPAGDGWNYDPFAAEVVDGRIYGRGASDCKSKVAVCLEIAHIIHETGIKLDYDLIIAATADEEKGSRLGIIPLLEKKIIRPTHAIVMDVEGSKIVVMQKGVLHIKAYIYGKKAHGAYTWKGENAIENAVEIIHKLKQHEFQFVPHALVHPPTMNIGIIKGGEAVNTVPDKCEFTIDVRFLPGMNANSILGGIKEIIEKTTQKYDLSVLSIQEPYELDRKNPLVTLLETAMKKNNIEVKIDGSEGATVMTFFQKFGIPAVSFGMGPEMAHQTDEYIGADDLVKCTKALFDFLKEY